MRNSERLPSGSNSGVRTATVSNRKSTRVVLFAENRELKHRLCGWRAVASLTARVARGEAFAGVVNEAVRECAANCESAMVAALVLSGGGSNMEVVSSVGLNRKVIEPIPVSHKEPIEVTARRIVPGWKAALGSSRRKPAPAGDEKAIYLPIVFQGIPLGVLCLERHPNVEEFMEDDRELAKAIADQIAIAAFLSGPAKLAINRERMERNMHFAHALKAKILPQHKPELSGYRIAVRCFNSIVCGGDFHDFVALPDDRFVIAIGEGTGRGVGAALNLAFVIPNLRGSLAGGADLVDAVKTLNRGLINRTQRGKMVSMCLLELNCKTGRVKLVRVGSTAVHLLDNGKVKQLTGGSGTPLGVLADCQVEGEDIQLKKGMSLIFSTDGLNKCLDADGKPFSGEQLRKALVACEQKTRKANPLARAIARSIAEKNRTDVLSDDVTILSLERLG